MLPNPNIALPRIGNALMRQSRSWPVYTWRARYSDTPWKQLGIMDQVLAGTLPQPDPHDAQALGVVRCPQCWDANTQRSLDEHCPRCAGVGWDGGYHAEIGLRMFVTTGDIDSYDEQTGNTINVSAMTAMHLATALILPGDLLMNNRTLSRYKVGRYVKQAGLGDTILARQVEMLPINPTDADSAQSGIVRMTPTGAP